MEVIPSKKNRASTYRPVGIGYDLLSELNAATAIQVKMTMLRALLVTVLCLASLSVRAEYLIYTLEDTLNAVFPCEPILIGTIQGMRGYTCADESNALSFTSTLQLKPQPINADKITDHIRTFIQGAKLSVRGNISHESIGRIGNDFGAIYSVDFELEGMRIEKHSILILKNGKFYTWSVLGVKGVSKIDVLSVFNNYSDYFSVN